MDFRLDTLQIAIPPGGRPTGRMRGALLGEAFAADFKGGDLPTLMREVRWPLELDASASGAVVHIDGVLAEPEAQEGIDLRFSLGASRAGDVGRWLGLSRNARALLTLAGQVRMVRDEWRLRRVRAHARAHRADRRAGACRRRADSRWCRLSSRFRTWTSRNWRRCSRRRIPTRRRRR